MKKRFALSLILLFTATGLNALELPPSDPVGIYAVIEKVVFEPNENAPQRIQVWGAFAISDARPGDNYQKPQKGYLYFKLPPGREASALKEWADLKTVSGSGQAIGFGGKYSMRIRFRKAEEKPADPDNHPLGIGVSYATQQDDIVDALKELIRKKQ
jgi:hypothetical protein